jgi:hypothetical protein
MLNYFWVGLLIETACAFRGTYFPQGQIRMAKEACFLVWFLHSAFILFLIGSLGGY